MRFFGTGGVVAFAAACVGLWTTSVRAGDDLDMLLREAKPPARFADLKAEFAVKTVTFTTTSGKSIRKQAIFDAQRMVGYLRGEQRRSALRRTTSA